MAAAKLPNAIGLMHLEDEENSHGDEEFRLVFNPQAQRFFSDMGHDVLNLVSIFGGAGTGKSTLMNHLTGVGDMFKIGHDLATPCTKGVDLSTHISDLTRFTPESGVQSAAAARERASRTLDKQAKDIKIAFVDAEGQGDRDAKYDTMLFAPIILISKVVLMNIREGRLQKNSILEKLDVLVTVVNRLKFEGESAVSSDEPLLGSLHIVIRDWNAKENRQQVKKMLMDEEVAKAGRGLPEDAAKRNAIRRRVIENFTSIDIWLCPSPVERTSDTNKEMRLDSLSEGYVHTLTLMRDSITQQLQRPMKFCGKVLTAKQLSTFMPVISDALNSADGYIFPNSVVDSIMKEEAVELRRSITREFEDFCQELRDREPEEGEGPIPLSVFAEIVQKQGEKMLHGFQKIGVDNKVVRVEAQGTANDLARIAESKAKDHKANVRRHVEQVLLNESRNFDKELQKRLEGLEFPAAHSKLKSIFAGVIGEATARLETLWRKYPKISSRFKKERQDIEQRWQELQAAEIKRNMLKVKVQYKTRLHVFELEPEESVRILRSRAKAHFLEDVAADGPVFLHIGKKQIHDDEQLITLPLGEDDFVKLTYIESVDWAKLEKKEILRRLQALMESDLVPAKHIQKGLETLAAKLEIPRSHWQSDYLINQVKAGAYDAPRKAIMQYGSDPSVVHAACCVIWRLLRNDENQQLIAAEGGIDLLLRALDEHRDVSKVQDSASRALGNLAASNPENQDTIVAEGGIRCLIAALTAHRGNADVQDSASAALAMLAVSEENKARIAEEGGVRCLVTALGKHRSSADVQHCAAAALANLAANNPDNQDKIANQGGIRALVASLVVHRGNHNVQDSASRALANLAANNPENQVKIATEGGIGALIAALVVHRGNAEVQDSAVRALTNLAANDENKVRIANEGGIGVLVGALVAHRANPDVQHCASAALGNLACNIENQIKIATEGGIGALVAALIAHRDNPNVQDSACRALTNLAASDENQQRIAASGGIGVLVDTLENHIRDVNVQDSACRALGNLAANNPDNQRRIAREGGIEALLTSLDTHRNSASVQHCAAAALGNLAALPDNQPLIVSKGGLEALLDAMRSHPQNPSVQNRGARALAMLAAHADNITALREQNVQGMLEDVRARHPTDSQVQEWATLGINRMKNAERRERRRQRAERKGQTAGAAAVAKRSDSGHEEESKQSAGGGNVAVVGL